MWLDLAIALSCGGGGVVCGWIMHAIGGFGNDVLVKQAAASITQHEVANEPTRERISEVADRLKAYAMSMAANVDEHQTKVQAVNNTLIESNDASPEAVIEAVGQLIEANETMQTQLQEAQDRIHEQGMQIESAERRAQTDALTQVPNRRALDSHMQQQHSLGPSRAGTLALLDVDHFKKFNDVYGHRAGDEVLRIVAKVLHSRLHSYGLVARFGGEEFAVILNGCAVDKAAGLVESARIAIGERDIQFEDKRLRVSASAGVAELMPCESIEDWLQRADDAMYRSKETGRNCSHWMDGSVPVRIEFPGEIPFASGGASSTRPSAAAATSAAASRQEPPAKTRSDSETGQDVEPDVPSKSATGASPAANKADPSAFAYLPDRKTLGVAFEDIRNRTQSSVSIFVMAITCIAEAGGPSMRSLLQIVRATLRSVDRLGCEDESTLLICMPSVDHATAYEQSLQIWRSAEAIGLGAKISSEHPVTIGVAEAGTSEEFADVVSRAVQLARQSREGGSDPVSIERQAATA